MEKYGGFPRSVLVAKERVPVYQVILCDDEKMVLTSLRASVDWEKNGFEIIGEANDGLAALEMIRQKKPQLVFTDIRMPGLNGLELMKQAASCGHPLFAAISGYAEFAYVQKALTCGAIGYCLKPFDEAEITGVLEKANRLLAGSESSVRAELRSILWDGSESSPGRLEEILRGLGCEWKSGEAMYAAAVPQTCGDIGTGLNLLFEAENRSCFLIRAKNLTSAMSRIRERIREFRCSAGISTLCSSPNRLGAAVKDAVLASQREWMTGKKDLYLAQDCTANNFDELHSQLLKVIREKDYTAAMTFFDQSEELLSSGRYSVRDAYNYYSTVMYALQPKTSGCVQYPETCRKMLRSYASLKKMFSALHASFADPTLFQSITPQIRNETFRKIAEAIDESFYKDITVQSVGSDFSISPNYLSQIFRRETGLTFTDYLTKRRLEYACRLLRTTFLPISEVASKSGFRDYYYFTRIFKKHTGQTPTEYRSSPRKENPSHKSEAD